MVTKIEQQGLQKETIRLKTQGYSLRTIAERLNKILGSETLDHKCVERFLKKKGSTMEQVISKTESLQIKEAEQFLKVTEQLTKLNKAMWKFFNKVKDDPKATKETIRAADHMIKQLKLAADIIGLIKPRTSSIKQTINIIDIGNKITMKLQQWKRSGALYCVACKSRDIAVDPSKID